MKTAITPMQQLVADKNHLPLATLATDDKSQKEFALLINLLLACLMARCVDVNTNPNVQSKIKDIESYLSSGFPSKEFERRFIDRAGGIGSGFLFRISYNNFIGVVTRERATSNVISILGDHHAANE